jgi:Rieske 2Fe-2S family protein
VSLPSPIDPALLRPVLASSLGESRTLPAQAYLSPEVFAWEQERFFESGWVCLGRADSLAGAGALSYTQLTLPTILRV